MNPIIRYAKKGELVTDPADWRGTEMVNRDNWLYNFSTRELSYLSNMADCVLDRIQGDPNQLINAKSHEFDLGPVAARLETVRKDLRDGRGFAVIRGLPVDDWSLLKTGIVYWAMGLQIGRPLSNNPDGDLIAHVTDMGLDYDHPEHRGYQTNAELNWHVDNCDVVTLLCMETAKSGGESRFASSIAVHNEVVRRRPDLARELGRPFYISRHGEVDPGEAPYYKFPVFNYVDNYLLVLNAAKHIEKGHELPCVPSLTSAQREALDIIQIISKELHLSMEFQKGDIQLLNNFVNVHTRTAYEDHPGQRRLLWRLWLLVEGQRPFPAEVEPWRRGIRNNNSWEQIRLEI